ncbi:ATP-binding protein [Pseudoneobacillus sp. C159]
MTVNYSGEIKNIFNVDSLLQGFSSVMDIPFGGEEINVDLSKVTFISPLGAISLLLLLDKLDQSFYVKLTPPVDSVVSYIERMDFLEHCTEEVYNCFDEHCDLEALSNRQRNDKSNALLEITSVKEAQDVDIVDESTRKILTNHGMKSRDANKITRIVTELVSNILDHSKGNGYTAIQYYPSHDKVQIAIGDNGMGIVNALKPTVLEQKNNKPITDLEVIQHAFEWRTSSKEETERGIGLFDTRSLAFENVKRTSFFLKTHKEIYHITNEKILVMDSSEYFPGTYISLEITF